MDLSFDWKLSLLWLVLGLFSIFISILLTRMNKTNVENFLPEKLPKWAIHVFGNRRDPYILFFRMGGLILAILSIPAGFISNRTGLDIAIWISVICYYVIPGFFIRKWR